MDPLHLRNVPDVAGDANTVSDTCAHLGCSSGTCCASPLWAGFIALANQPAAARGLRRIGLPDPVVSMIGGLPGGTNAFHDAVGGTGGKYTAVPRGRPPSAVSANRSATRCSKRSSRRPRSMHPAAADQAAA